MRAILATKNLASRSFAAAIERCWSGACNASHLVEARMCRWLLRMRDLAGSDDLIITQEFLGQLLGVRRSSVSIVANTLKKADLIRYRRGSIKILDVDGQREAACECYDTVRGHYERLLCPENGSGVGPRVTDSRP
jgi:CRP-like cAMP-binding protein